VRITGLSVDGFGVFCAHEIRDLPPGLTVLYGPNEAGKTTLLAFLRGVLFGFPRPAKNRRAFYPPLAGGRHGGRVFLETDGGTIAIEREVGRSARILLESGADSPADLSDLEFQQLIGGVDAQTFRTVFAFSLDELRDFDSLTGEQVRARIFAAGVGGAGPSVRQVIQGMERACGQLLKPRSLEGEINRILSELATCEHTLQQARVLAEGYPTLLDEKGSARARLQWLDEREREMRSAQTFHERLLDLWPVWVDIDFSRRQLDALEPVDGFVPDAVRRLTEAKEGLESARRSLVRLEEQKARRDDEIEQLRAGMFDGIWELAPAVEKQVGLLPLYRNRLQEREIVRARVALIGDRLRQSLGDLGPGVGEETLTTTDTSLPRLEEVRGWRSKLSEAASQTRQGAEHLDLATAQQVRAQAERDREQVALEALPRFDPEMLAGRAQALRIFRGGIAGLRAKQAILEGRVSASAAMGAERSRSSQARGPSAGLAFGVMALVLALVVATIVAAVSGWTIAAAVAGALAAAGLVAVAARAASHRAGGGQAGHSMGAYTESFRREQAEQDTLRRDISRLEAELAGPAAVLGLADLRDLSELETIDAALSEANGQVTRWNEQSSALTRAEQRHKDAVLEESLASGRSERLKDEQRGLEQEFRARITGWGLPVGLSQEGVEEYLRGLAAAKELAARRHEDRAHLDRLEQDKTDWEGESLRLVEAARGAVAKRMGIVESIPAGARRDEQQGDVAGSAVEPALLALAEACRAETDIRQRAAELAKANRELEVELERAGAEAVAGQRRWDELLGQAGVRDEVEFLQKLSVFEKRQELEQSLSVGESMLVKTVGQGREADAFRDALACGEVSAWEERLEEARREIEEARAEAVGLMKVEGDIERRLRELEDSADVPSIEIELEGRRTELGVALKQWRVNTLAGLLVRETLAQFTQERQPMVLAEASGMFQRVTQGRYERVQRSTDEEGIVVVDVDGRVKTPDELSRGAAEQLYLCLRLGLAEEFARRAEPMPLVMDDVLVNFDAARRRTTAELLIDFSERHQILLFTCHEEIADLVRLLRPDTRLIDLS
jgi:uncharacterized protein YhaN